MELDEEILDDIICQIGASANYENIFAEISNLISLIDNNLEQEKADIVLKAIKEKIIEQL